MSKEDDLDNFAFQNRRSFYQQAVPDPKFRGLDWDRVQSTEPTGHAVVEALKRCVRIRQATLRGGSVLLYGATGVGKTMLTAVCWQQLAEYVPDRTNEAEIRKAGTLDNVAWVPGHRLPDLWRDATKAGLPQGVDGKNHLSTVKLLVLDDLDKVAGGEGWNSTLFGLLDSRMLNPDLITFITMNRSPEDFVRRFDGDQRAAVLRRLDGAVVHARLDALIRVKGV